MKNIDWFSNGRQTMDVDAAWLDREPGRLAAPDADDVRRTMLRQRKKKALMLTLSFVALWLLASRLSALLFSSGVMEVLIGFWIALNGTIFINAVVVARMRMPGSRSRNRTFRVSG
jgi:hypothetical protein